MTLNPVVNAEEPSLTNETQTTKNVTENPTPTQFQELSQKMAALQEELAQQRQENRSPSRFVNPIRSRDRATNS